eukprot:6070657-Pleurochrysis_carterae.AAC.6
MALSPERARSQRAAPITGSNILFGSTESTQMKTTSEELSRIDITNVHHLQRALQMKIAQATRTQSGTGALFNRLDRSRCGSLDLDDLRAATSYFNIKAPDELIVQLMNALDRDHDQRLSHAEFANGLGAQAVQLHEPAVSASTRRQFRSIPFHHPLHNAAEAYQRSGGCVKSHKPAIDYGDGYSDPYSSFSRQKHTESAFLLPHHT